MFTILPKFFEHVHLLHSFCWVFFYTYLELDFLSVAHLTIANLVQNRVSVCF